MEIVIVAIAYKEEKADDVDDGFQTCQLQDESKIWYL